MIWNFGRKIENFAENFLKTLQSCKIFQNDNSLPQKSSLTEGCRFCSSSFQRFSFTFTIFHNHTLINSNLIKIAHKTQLHNKNHFNLSSYLTHCRNSSPLTTFSFLTWIFRHSKTKKGHIWFIRLRKITSSLIPSSTLQKPQNWGFANS